MLCFLKKHLVMLWRLRQQNHVEVFEYENAALHMQFLIFNWRTIDCKCVLRYFMPEYYDAFVYLFVGND